MTYSYILIYPGHFDKIVFIKMSGWQRVKGVDAPSNQAIYGTFRDRIFWGKQNRLPKPGVRNRVSLDHVSKDANIIAETYGSRNLWQKLWQKPGLLVDILIGDQVQKRNL